MKYDLGNKAIVVLGAGISGLSAAACALRHGAAVTLYDAKTETGEKPAVQALVQKGMKLLCGEELPEVADWQLAVKSPGIPYKAPFVQALLEAHIPVIGELELACAVATVPFVAITGTNGKTTTTTLTYEIIKNAAIPVLLGGNIGLPLAEVAEQNREGVLVAEISSFQLEDSPSFAPHISAVLNITPDHLDRHGSLENYIAAKRSIVERQSENDFAVLNFEDEVVRGFAAQTKAHVLYFSSERELEEGAFVKDGCMVIRFEGREYKLLPFEDMLIRGKHNLENALAAALCAFAAGSPIDAICSTLRSFPGVEHRQERVRELDGVLYINDSKGTNPDSTIKALEAYDAPIILLAGGYDKKISFREMLLCGKPKLKALVLLGACKHIIEKEALEAGISCIYMCGSFEEAFAKCVELAVPGDTVMLSPACASWDMFKSYEERGKKFKELVNAL